MGKVREYLSENRDDYERKLRLKYINLISTGILDDAIADLLLADPYPNDSPLDLFILACLNNRVKDIYRKCKKGVPLRKSIPCKFSWDRIEARLDIHRLLSQISEKESDCIIAHHIDQSLLPQAMSKWNIAEVTVRHIAGEGIQKIRAILKRTNEI